MSHPAWDAWIEILEEWNHDKDHVRRIPHGMRGLKFLRNGITIKIMCVASRMGCVD